MKKKHQETINIQDLKLNDFIEWVIVESMANTQGDFEENFPGVDSSNLTVEMKVNGKEVALVQTLNKIESVLDKSILDKAKELLKERLFDIQNKLEKIENTIDETFEALNEPK